MDKFEQLGPPIFFILLIITTVLVCIAVTHGNQARSPLSQSASSQSSR